MKETEKYKIAFKHITGDLSQHLFKKKQFHQALALVGKNVPVATVTTAWSPYVKGGMSYAEFCECVAEMPTPNVVDMFNEFFGKEISRRDLKSILLKSDAEFSAKRYTQFLEEMFGEEEHIQTSTFLTKYRLLDESVLEDIKSGKVEPKLDEQVGQFRIDMSGDIDGFEAREEFEPDVTKFGGLFHHDNSSHRYEMKLVSSSRVTVRLTLNTVDLNVAFLIVKNETIEAVATPVTKNIDQPYAQWSGDLTKGTYRILPFPMSIIKHKKTGHSWVPIVTSDRHGEARFTETAKSALRRALSLFDTSGNQTIDHDELEQFQMRTEDVDSLDEELWKLIKRQFEVVNNELTSRGFITMHEAQLQQEGEEDIKTMFTCLGFSPRLEPINNALMKLDVHAPESNVQLSALPIARCLDMVGIIRDNAEPVKRDQLPRDLNAFTYSTDSMCIALIENKNDVAYTTAIKSENIAPADAKFVITSNKKLSVLVTARNDPTKPASVGVKITRKQ